jgi:hypothetical protein
MDCSAAPLPRLHVHVQYEGDTTMHRSSSRQVFLRQARFLLLVPTRASAPRADEVYEPNNSHAEYDGRFLPVVQSARVGCRSG